MPPHILRNTDICFILNVLIEFFYVYHERTAQLLNKSRFIVDQTDYVQYFSGFGSMARYDAINRNEDLKILSKINLTLRTNVALQ